MWKRILKEEIKKIPVGSTIRVGGVKCKLLGHYLDDDFGFDTDKLDTFSYLRWDNYEDSRNMVEVKTTKWVKIEKEDIKKYPIGTKLKVNGQKVKLTEHYNEYDFGFNMDRSIEFNHKVSSVFGEGNWRNPNTTVKVKVKIC